MDDWSLSAHYTFYEMTHTSNEGLLVQNRREAMDFIHPLVDLANMMEGVRSALYKPVYIHSGFRCPELNGVTPGSSLKSQHMKGEACDFTAWGESTKPQVDNLFKDVLDYLVKKKVSFGQLINESADRGYNDRSNWIHLSLGFPYRPEEKCGEVLTMKDGVYEKLRSIR